MLILLFAVVISLFKFDISDITEDFIASVPPLFCNELLSIVSEISLEGFIDIGSPLAGDNVLCNSLDVILN